MNHSRERLSSAAGRRSLLRWCGAIGAAGIIAATPFPAALAQWSSQFPKGTDQRSQQTAPLAPQTINSPLPPPDVQPSEPAPSASRPSFAALTAPQPLRPGESVKLFPISEVFSIAANYSAAIAPTCEDLVDDNKSYQRILYDKPVSFDESARGSDQFCLVLRRVVKSQAEDRCVAFDLLEETFIRLSDLKVRLLHLSGDLVRTCDPSLEVPIERRINPEGWTAALDRGVAESAVTPDRAVRLFAVAGGQRRAQGRWYTVDTALSELLASTSDVLPPVNFAAVTERTSSIERPLADSDLLEGELIIVVRAAQDQSILRGVRSE
jgi:hypothetical protein